jgi:hypothetical protein
MYFCRDMLSVVNFEFEAVIMKGIFMILVFLEDVLEF